MGGRVRFRATLQATDSGAWVELPDAAVAGLEARGRTSVVADIDGHCYVGQVMPYTFADRGTRMVLGVTKGIRAATGKQTGDTLEIELDRDERSRSAHVPIPSELSAALAADDAAAAAFERLAPSHRREYAEHVAQAKRPETRQRRAAQVVERLSANR